MSHQMFSESSSFLKLLMEHSDMGLAVFTPKIISEAGKFNSKLKSNIEFNFKWSN